MAFILIFCPSFSSHCAQITRRYAEFATCILTLNYGYDDMILSHRLVKLEK